MNAPQPWPSPGEEDQRFPGLVEQDDPLKPRHELLKLQQYQWELQWKELNQQAAWLAQRIDWLDQQEKWLERRQQWLNQQLSEAESE